MKETYRLNRKVIDYEELLSQEISDDLPERVKAKIAELNSKSPNKTFIKLQTYTLFLKKAFNWDDYAIRTTFFVMLFLYWVEYILVNLTVTNF
jgi:hypothetical protein